MVRSFVTILSCLILVLQATAQPSADVAWLQLYGDTGEPCEGSQADKIYSAQLLPDGGFILCGTSASYSTPSTNQLWILRADSAGHVLWQQAYDSAASGVKLLAAADGGFIAGGNHSRPAAEGGAQFSLTKLDADGAPLWQQFYPDSTDYLTDLVATADGGYLLTGSNYPSGGGANLIDIVVLKTDSSGALEWQRNLHRQYADFSAALSATLEGDYLLLGGSRTTGSGPNDILLTRLTTDGDTLWQRLYALDGSQTPTALAQLPDSSFIIEGTQALSDTPLNAFLTHISPTGELLWHRTVGHADTSEGGSTLAVLPDGFLIGGTSASPSVPLPVRIHLTRTDLDGAELWRRTWTFDIAADVKFILPVDSGVVFGGSTWCAVDNLPEATDGYLMRVWLPGMPGPDTASAVPPLALPLPLALELSLYPNPFNAAAELRYTLPRAMPGSLRIYDLLGREVVVLTDGQLAAGEQTVTWDARGRSSGLYFVRLQAGESVLTRKLILLR